MFIFFYRPLLALHRHTRKIAHMLVGTGQLVEKGGFAAILLTSQRKGKQGPLGQRIFVLLGMVLARLTQSGMGIMLMQGVAVCLLFYKICTFIFTLCIIRTVPPHILHRTHLNLGGLRQS